MKGQGVTNYAVDKPTYAYTTATTEFDDELIRRGVVTMEQAMVAKGASAEEAHRLAEVARSNTHRTNSMENRKSCDKRGNDDDDDDDDDDSDDEFLEDDDFLQQYRQQRLAELKSAASPEDKNGATYHGEIMPIQRPDWIREVNEASMESWVVVTLTSNNVELTGAVEAAATALARLCPSVKFVLIPSTGAIENWPDHNLPSIFVYRYGKMQHEMIKLKKNMTALQLQKELIKAGVEFTETELQKARQYGSQEEKERHNSLRRRLLLSNDDDEDDDDEVI